MATDGQGADRRITLVLGGARSGKSRRAEEIVEAMGGQPVYLATAAAGDAEMAERIARHRTRRGHRWHTVEEPLELTAALARHATPETAVLVDCLTLWLSNLYGAGRDVLDETNALIHALDIARGPVVLVSNEVGLGIVPDNALARRFRDDAGRLNQAVAEIATHVIFVAAGLSLTLKPAS